MRVCRSRDRRHADRNSRTYVYLFIHIYRIVFTKLKNPQKTSDYRARPTLITIELGDEDTGCLI